MRFNVHFASVLAASVWFAAPVSAQHDGHGATGTGGTAPNAAPPARQEAPVQRPAPSAVTPHTDHAPATPHETRDPAMQHATGESGMTERHPVLPPHSRLGSGTSWLPDSSPMHAIHAMAGNWTFMVHGNAFVGPNVQLSDRGDEQITAVNWLMGMASHPLLGGEMTLRAMLSAEPWTLPGDGYPLVLQTGETWQGERLHDRQHPHDLFMELAVLQQIPIARDLGIEIYLAPVGEPAIGPTAFPHRLSSNADPLAPLGHHWQDSTHITYGVITAGVFGERWKIEGSWFNGREPDERRWDFDFRVPDSYAARFSFQPADEWSAQASWAFLRSPEALDPEHSVHRLSTSVAHTTALAGPGYWASTLAIGVNIGGDDEGPSALLETNVDLDGHHVLFGRAEIVAKSAGALVLEGVQEETRYPIANLSFGYQYAFGPIASLTPALGVRGNVGLVPGAIEPFYGTRVPMGGMLYLQLHPAAQRMPAGHGM